MTRKPLGDDPYIHADCLVVGSTLGKFTEVGQGSRLRDSSLEDYSYCERLCDIANARIAKFSNIASFVRIGPTDHPMERASLHHFLYRSNDYWPDRENDADFFERRAARHAFVGNDTWIGHAAIIKPDITVGDGAVIAANAVVTKDVAPYTVVAGIPAKPIRQRFPAQIAERLMALAWWDWDHEDIGQALDDFRTLEVEAFLGKHGG
jgi:phosphonate metabolism protein (transferase hexapeptide repeat family)